VIHENEDRRQLTLSNLPEGIDNNRGKDCELVLQVLWLCAMNAANLGNGMGKAEAGNTKMCPVIFDYSLGALVMLVSTAGFVLGLAIPGFADVM